MTYERYTVHTKNEKCKKVISLDSARNYVRYVGFANPTWATSWFPFFYFFLKSMKRFYLSN